MMAWLVSQDKSMNSVRDSVSKTTKREDQMAQWVKMVATKPNNFKSVPENHRQKKKMGW